MISSEAGPTRSRNAAATRAAILESARNRFAREGYDGASLREIAADAGVDAALISRYFGSKDDLFREVLTEGGAPDELTGGDVSELAPRLAHMLIIEPVNLRKLEKFLIVLRSISSPKALETIRKTSLTTVYLPLEKWIGGDDGAMRARLVAGIMMGFTISRIIDQNHLLDPEQKEAMRAKLAEVLQTAVS